MTSSTRRAWTGSTVWTHWCRLSRRLSRPWWGISASLDCPILSGPVWGDGNILLGGGGSDTIEGRGADDIIDGDKYVNVRLSVRNGAGVEIGTAGVNQTGQSAMTSQVRDSNGALILGGKTLQQAVFAGDVDPGNIVAVREIVDPPASTTVSTDTAVFSGPRANYTITPGAGFVTVTDNVGTDGIDTCPERRAAAVPERDGTSRRSRWRCRTRRPTSPRRGATGTRRSPGSVRPRTVRRSPATLRGEVWYDRRQHDEQHRAGDALSHRDWADPRSEVHVRGAGGQRVRCRAVRGLQRDHGGEHPCGTDRAGGHPEQLLGVAVVDSGR